MTNPAWIEQGKAWLLKSRSDINAARALIFGEKQVLDAAVYHCQQACEKALKAWITVNGGVFRKTHELEELLAQCQEYDDEFGNFGETALRLTPFATEYRYPGDLFEPPLDEAKSALVSAQHLVDFVNAKFESLA